MSKLTANAKFEAPLLYSPDGAARLLGLSRATIYRMIAAGELATVHAGMKSKALRITRTSIDSWLTDRIAEGNGDEAA
jgi:excisionase family DNA binding protein